jgi:hypothetical protein
MTLEDITNQRMFTFARYMTNARKGNPKYIIKKEPVPGTPTEIFEYIPNGEDVSEGEYKLTNKIIPDMIIKEPNSRYYIIIGSGVKITVYQKTEKDYN